MDSLLLHVSGGCVRSVPAAARREMSVEVETLSARTNTSNTIAIALSP